MASNPDNGFPQDRKVLSDVEQGSPPSYPLAEPEELVVGGPKSKCCNWRARRWCSRRGECHSNGGARKRCKVFRVFKFLLTAVILLGVVHFVSSAIKIHKALKTVECTTIIPANAPDGGLQYTLPLAQSSSHVFIHDSLTGGETCITHDSAVADGTFQVTLDFSKEGTQNDAVYDGCMVQLRHGTGVALISRESNSTRAQIGTIGLRFADSVSAPAVQLMGKKKHLTDDKLRKLIRWWRRRHSKE